MGQIVRGPHFSTISRPRLHSDSSNKRTGSAFTQPRPARYRFVVWYRGDIDGPFTCPVGFRVLSELVRVGPIKTILKWIPPPIQRWRISPIKLFFSVIHITMIHEKFQGPTNLNSSSSSQWRLRDL